MRLFLLSLLLLSNAVLAADARARLEAFANGLNALSGEFTQTTSDANGELQEESQGTLALAAHVASSSVPWALRMSMDRMLTSPPS